MDDFARHRDGNALYQRLRQELAPHEELNQALTKSFSATGFNYSSKSRVTNLSLANENALPATADKKVPNVAAVLDIVRGFSLNIAGALDLKSKRSEALYDLHYNKDNVEISVRLPLLVDYNAQTIYLGPSIFNIALNIASPQEITGKDQLIKINIPELMRELTGSSPELAKLYDDKRFSAQNMDLINNVFKAAIIKAVAGLDDARFSDQPLTELDKKAGVERRIQVKLGHDDTVGIILELIDTIAQTLFQEGAISKNEYAVLLLLTDEEKLDPFLQMIDLAMTQDVSIAPTGYVHALESQLTVTDPKGNFHLGLENVSAFDRYNAPQFSISPETSQLIDFKEVLKAILAINPKTKKTAPSGGVPDKDNSQTGGNDSTLPVPNGQETRDTEI